jgi:hypothetical protein
VTLSVCPVCKAGKPRCRICNLPVAAASPNGVCVTCQQSLRPCLTCGQKIGSHKSLAIAVRPVQAFEFDGLGPYCRNCLERRAACDICGAPLTDEFWQLSDGRKVCAYCHATAVYLPEVAAALYEEMKAVVVQTMGLRLNVPTGLALVDRNQLSEVIRQQAIDSRPAVAGLSRNPTRETGDRDNLVPRDLGGLAPRDLGGPAKPGDASLSGTPAPHSSTVDLSSDEAPPVLDAQRTLGIYARRGIRRAIYLQTGLPRMLFIQVAAHEYAHAWQGENCPLLRNTRFYEGFAEWVAYHLIGFYGYAKGQARMLEREDVYGQGLKWALDVEARHGLEGVLHACRRME